MRNDEIRPDRAELRVKEMARQICMVPGCGRVRSSQGICEMHHRRVKKTGTIEGRKRYKDIAGQRFGRLVAIEPIGSKSGAKLWKCACDCGATTSLTQPALTSGNTRSCGCLRTDGLRQKGRGATHGKSRPGAGPAPEYISWFSMLQRCENPNNPSYHNYGGRGIVVCDEWHDAARFMADMGARPPGHTLDRIDPDGSYCPSNCRWATIKEQSRNKRRHRWMRYHGVVGPVFYVADETGIEYKKLYRMAADSVDGAEFIDEVSVGVDAEAFGFVPCKRAVDDHENTPGFVEVWGVR